VPGLARRSGPLPAGTVLQGWGRRKSSPNCAGPAEFAVEDIGFAGTDDRLWQLLCLFARLGGRSPARNASVSDKDAITLRKQVSNLRQRPATIFPIAGDSIRSVHGTGAYRCTFKIGLDQRDGFPSPPDRWDDCRLTELEDGRISISERVKEVFAARAISEEIRQRTAIEAAEHLGVRTEDYDLRLLGLADQAGNSTSQGRLLLEFLHKDGNVSLSSRAASSTRPRWPTFRGVSSATLTLFNKCDLLRSVLHRVCGP
jgi:hypothetical protein